MEARDIVLIEGILSRMEGIQVERFNTRMVVSHTAEDWGLIEAIAARFGATAERWMLNDKPRTTIY